MAIFSIGWIINFTARLGDGDAARNHYLALLRRSTLPLRFCTGAGLHIFMRIVIS